MTTLKEVIETAFNSGYLKPRFKVNSVIVKEQKIEVVYNDLLCETTQTCCFSI